MGNAMNILHFGVTFWFNIYDDYSNLLDKLRQELQDEFSSFNYRSEESNNLLEPVITAINNEKKTNMHVTRISSQYNMDSVEFATLNVNTLVSPFHLTYGLNLLLVK